MIFVNKLSFTCCNLYATTSICVEHFQWVFYEEPAGVLWSSANFNECALMLLSFTANIGIPRMGSFQIFFFFSFSCSLTFFWINSIQSWLNTDFSTSSRWSSANSNVCSVLHSSKRWERLSFYLFSISWWSSRTCQPTGWEGQQELRRSREAKNWSEAFLPLLEASCLGRSK